MFAGAARCFSLITLLSSQAACEAPCRTPLANCPCAGSLHACPKGSLYLTVSDDAFLLRLLPLLHSQRLLLFLPWWRTVWYSVRERTKRTWTLDVPELWYMRKASKQCGNND
jgi:hypothetical protein